MPDVNAAQWALRTGSFDKAELEKQLLLIGIAVGAVALAYQGIENVKQTARTRRTAYIKERNAKMATFVLFKDKDPRDLTKEEQFFNRFIAYSKEKIPFDYFGMSEFVLDSGSGTVYSVLPLYCMSEALGHPVANRTPLDQQRRTISLFLKAGVPKYLNQIDTYLPNEWKITSIASSVWHGENYLNNLRAERMLVIGLANLLWNLEHPVNPTTGYPLTTSECIQLTGKVSLYLEGLLKSAETAQPPYLKNLVYKKPWLVSFVNKVHVYTVALHDAYVDEQLHQINIDDVTNSAHQILETMDRGIMSLMYKRRDPWTDKPDNETASELAGHIGYMRDLLARSPDLIRAFDGYKHFDSNAMVVNDPLMTVMDVVIVFCHLDKKSRNRLITSLRTPSLKSPQKSSEWAEEFANTLEELNTAFIRPIEKISKSELHLSNAFFRKQVQSQQMAQHCAKRLVPFITLILADLETEVDVPELLPTSPSLTGKQQIERINTLAGSKAPSNYYQRGLFSLVGAHTAIADKLDDLLDCQNRIVQVVQLLDTIKTAINTYRHLLQEIAFQQCLLDSLTAVKDEYALLKNKLDGLAHVLSKQDGVSLALKEILSQTETDMSSQIETLNKAVGNFKRVVGAPNFTRQNKKMQDALIVSLDEQILKLWNKDSGLKTLLSPPEAAPVTPSITVAKAPAVTAKTYVDANKVVALSQLAQSCLQRMSYISLYSHKGVLLYQLSLKIDKQKNFTEAQFERYLKELVHIVAGYRETYFWQAAYGQTTTAKHLMNKIRDPAFALPLGTMLFGPSSGKRYQDMTQKEIAACFVALRQKEAWQAPVTNIQAVMAF